MNKGEFIDSVAQATGESKRTVSEVVEAAITTIEQQLKRGEKVTLPGFGTFERRHRAARQGRNPQTGDTVQIAATNVPAFKPGAGFKDAVK